MIPNHKLVVTLASGLTGGSNHFQGFEKTKQCGMRQKFKFIFKKSFLQNKFKIINGHYCFYGRTMIEECAVVISLACLKNEHQ